MRQKNWENKFIIAIIMIKMNKIILIASMMLLTSNCFAAGSSNDGKASLYKEAKKLVLKAKKLEKKDKAEKALKLYSKAYEKLIKAYKKDKKNADILNYLGFTLRKSGNFEEAEKFYLAGLEIKPDHKGINEYLGELYVQTDRIELAKERLQVLVGCKCEEYEELKELIEGKKDLY